MLCYDLHTTAHPPASSNVRFARVSLRCISFFFFFSFDAKSKDDITHASTISRIFNEHTLGDEIRMCRCWAAAAVFIFQVKSANPKSLKPIADGSKSRSTTPINVANLVCV